MSCTNAVLNPHNLQVVETENEPAVVGTIVHALCQSLVETGAYDLTTLNGLSEADQDRGRMMFNNFLTVWQEARLHMTSPHVEVQFEVELSHCVLTGHIDCLSIQPARAFILDYKTGRQHEDHYHQMAAYAMGLWVQAGKPENFVIYVSTVYLEDTAVHPYTFTPDSLRQWEAMVAAQIVQQRYTVGRKCAVCSLQDSCPAARYYAASIITLLGNLHESEYTDLPSWESLSPEDRGAIVDKMYMLDKSLDRLRLSLRNHVKSKGAVDIGGGKEMAIIEQEERTVNASAAIPILLNRIGPSAVTQVSRLPLEAVLTAYAAKAAKGRKTQARNELLAELEAAGAIQKSKSTKMFRRPVGEKVLK